MVDHQRGPNTLVVDAAAALKIEGSRLLQPSQTRPCGLLPHVCLVEIEGPLAAYVANGLFGPLCTRGMVVRTDSDQVQATREEQTWRAACSNHPLDCPICDKGGECPLQIRPCVMAWYSANWSGQALKKNTI